MRKVSLFILVLAILMSVLSFNVSADPDKKAIVSYGTPVIDAEIDEIWNSVEGYKTTNIYQDAERLTDTVSEWKMMWDENRMYILAVVTDSEINSQNETFWQNDCTQLFISFSIWEDFDIEEYDGSTDSLGIRWAVPGVLQEPDNFLIQLMGSGDYLEQDDPLYLEVERAFKITDTGYIQEYAFDPRKYCSSFKLEAGQRGGADFIIDDSMKDSPIRDVLYHLSIDGDTWIRPENLTTFELAAKPPEPEPEPEAGAGGGDAAELPAPAPVAEAPAPAPAPAPVTADPVSLIVFGSLISAAGVIIARKRK